MANSDPERYGNTKVATIRKKVDNLRVLILAQGTPEIQDAWEKLEAFVPFLVKCEAPEEARKHLDSL